MQPEKHISMSEGDRCQKQLAQTMKGHADIVGASAFFKDGRRVVTGSGDKTLRIWDVEKEELVGGPFEGHHGWVLSVAVSPDDRRIASGGNDKTIIIWDVESKQKVFDPLVKHTRWVWSVCFSPDGKRLASGSDDETVILWDAETGAVLATLKGHQNWVLSVAFSPDGLKLASGSGDRTIRVWRTDNAELLLNINAHQSSVQSIVWSPDGQQFVSASWDETVKFWNSLNGDQIGIPCTGHADFIRSLAISSDGSFITTASDDKTVRLWSTKTHQQIGKPLEHTAFVYCVAISPNGDLLVSGDREGKVLVWSLENTLSVAFGLDPSYEFFFLHRSKAKLQRNLYAEALSDAEKVIKFNPSSYHGYELKHVALHGTQRYDEAFEAFKIMLSKSSDAQTQKLRQQYLSPSEATKHAVRRAIHAQLENAPFRLLNTSTGRLCNRDAQSNAFMESTEHENLLYSLAMHAPLPMESIEEAVTKYFGWVMLSHRWEGKELLLHDIQDKVVYNLDPDGTVVKLQKFCELVRDAGYHWAWSDTCCIDQKDPAEVQRSVNSMFTWYRNSALTIVYLSDVLSESGALADSAWNTRGWTVQEFLAPKIILFYQEDWTLYLNDHSSNHKKSVTIMKELEDSTGIDAQFLTAFHPGITDARKKLQWASSRVTTFQEDIAYSLFGIFGIPLPVNYGEGKQFALGRLLQEIVAQLGDITALDWIGKSSDFNSCLPADIISYKPAPYMLPSLTEDQIQASVSSLQDAAVVKLASKLSSRRYSLTAPRFANRRLHLPCITFPVTAVRRISSQGQKGRTYELKAVGLQDISITTEKKLNQFSRAKSTRQSYLLVLPWNRYDLELPDLAEETESVDDVSEVESWQSDDSFSESSQDNEPVDSESSERASRLLVRLGQPFGALLLAQQRVGEYMRIASDHSIIARVKDVTAVLDMMDIRILEIL
ncbi:WD40-repeat-containing domain protein [Suillus ampliporus]|nr:WD40-repeat-containing domain protein [Suillus ampliporus]